MACWGGAQSKCQQRPGTRQRRPNQPQRWQFGSQAQTLPRPNMTTLPRPLASLTSHLKSCPRRLQRSTNSRPAQSWPPVCPSCSDHTAPTSAVSAKPPNASSPALLCPCLLPGWASCTSSPATLRALVLRPPHEPSRPGPCGSSLPSALSSCHSPQGGESRPWPWPHWQFDHSLFTRVLST